MCAIAGILSITGDAPINPDLADAMSARMASRGQDGHGIWIDASHSCVLAHRRLAIIETGDDGAQPMIDHTGRFVITFNGEIYNYRELRSALSADDVAFRSHSDTEVLLELYKRYGADMLSKLRGMFAFAIWDDKDRSLFLARDTYGIKPLYYHSKNGHFAFASQVKALLVDPNISRAIHPAGYAGYLLWGSVPEPFTLFADIKSLPAGCCMMIDQGHPAPTPMQFDSVANNMLSQHDDGLPDIRTALLESVRYHLVADVEVGCFLSGGIDSGALVGLMRDCGQDKIRTFTLDFSEFDNSSENETPYAAIVSKHYNTEHHVERIGRAEFDDSVPNILLAMDQPSIDGVNSWFVARTAHRAGLKVALSGLGGDELFAGYSTFTTVPTMVERWRRMGNFPLLQHAAKRLSAPFGRLIFPHRPKVAYMPNHSGSIESAYILRRSLTPPGQLLAEATNEVLRTGLKMLDDETRLRALTDGKSLDVPQKISILESCQYMRNQLLRDTDWASMAHSLEVRVPFVDVPLLRSVGQHLHSFRGDSGKQLIGMAPSRPLPAPILNKEKSGFAIPVDQWTAKTGREPGMPRLGNWAATVLSNYALTTGLDLPD